MNKNYYAIIMGAASEAVFGRLAEHLPKTVP